MLTLHIRASGPYYGDDDNYTPLLAGTYFTSGSQEYLRSRVASVTIEDSDDNNKTTYNHASHYSYDVHGNVKELIQENQIMPVAGQQFKKVNYTYDLISGKVNQVAYQPNTKDMFLHKYEYDADNRITNVYTSKDNIIWEQDSKYFYYLHGPMARMETGNDKVQASDYAYTIQGWIKGVNSNILNSNSDIGRDGVGTLTSAASGGAASLVINKFNAQDAYGYSLTYFNNASQKDYLASNGSTGTSNDFIASIPVGMAQSPDLFNGNIRQMVTSYLDARSPGKTYTAIPLLKNYTYDQLNRIETATTNNNINLATNTWNTTPTLANMYKEVFSYDQNGNILTAKRSGHLAASLAMDDLSYSYVAGTNKLDYVTDAIAGAPYGNDFKSGQTAGNYTYDKIGNLISDASENITKIDWTVYGKIKKITKASAIGPISTITFKYDASGNRVSKTLMTGTSTNKLTTYYVRDAQGNVMSVYEYNDLGSATLNTYALTEQHIYGSSRVGMSTLSLDPTVLTPTGSIFTRKLGFKTYELSNHLGNVLTVISDRKIAVSLAGSPTVVDHFSSEILSSNDYYAFGATMNGRKYSSSTSYRYGFNGKENDNEVKGDGNSLDFGARIYDSRLGRFLSVDPKWKSFCNFSPYSFAANSPIVNIDEEGESPFPSISMLRAMALASGYLKSTLSVNTSISVAAGVYASYSKGLAVDSKGNVMVFSTVGGIANGLGLNGGQFGLSSNAGASTSVGGAILPGAKTVNDLLGKGVYFGGETSIEGLIGAGGGVELLGDGNLAGASANVSFGISALPVSGVVQITNTSGIIMHLGEMEKIINTYENAQAEFSSKYYELNDNEKTRAGGWGDVWGVWQSGKLEVVTQEAGKNADGQTQYETVIKGQYFFILNSNGSKEGINPSISIPYEYKTGVLFTKDSDGNMHSNGEVK